MATLQDVADIVIAGKAKKTPAMVQDALDSGFAPKDILNTMIDAMSVVGERFSRNEIFVPEMLVAAKAMKKGVDVLKPLLSDGSVGAMGKMVMGTVDLGVDVPKERFVEAVRENPGVKIVGLSALLTTTMPALEEAVAYLNQQDFRKDIKIMVGGAPITQEFADKIGADAYTEDAASAAQKAKELVS